MPPRPSEDAARKIEHLREKVYSRTSVIKERPRHTLGVDHETVPHAWAAVEEQQAQASLAPAALQFTRTTLSWILVLAIGFFIATVGYFVYYFTVSDASLTGAPSNVFLAVDGPVTVIGGQNAQFQVKVVNNNAVPLELADLIVEYPPGTRDSSDFATLKDNEPIALGTLEPGASKQGQIQAVLLGSAGSKAALKVELQYRLAGSNAIQVARTEYPLVFDSVPVSLAIDAQTQAISGQQVKLLITARSNIDSLLRDVVLTVNYPFGFVPLTLVPKPVVDSLWQLGDLYPGQVETIEIRGTLSGSAKDEKSFLVSVGTRGKESIQKIEVELAQVQHVYTMAQPFVSTKVLVSSDGNKTDKDFSYFQPGKNVSATIEYVNDTDKPVEKLVVAAKFEGFPLDKTTIRVPEGFYRSADDTIVWDAVSTRGKLTSVPPHATGTLQFNFLTPTTAQLGTSTKPQFSITIHTAGRRTTEKGVPENVQASSEKIIRLSSVPVVKSEVVYTANPFSVVGPFPPKVDTETTLAVILEVSNTSNRIQNGKIVYQVPPYVRYLQRAPQSESVVFNANDSTITWNLGLIDTNTQQTAARRIGLNLGLTPSVSQIGQNPVLLTDGVFSGIDMFTGEQFSKSLDDSGVVINTLLKEATSSTQVQP
jgi:hypothetical protein